MLRELAAPRTTTTNSKPHKPSEVARRKSRSRIQHSCDGICLHNDFDVLIVHIFLHFMLSQTLQLQIQFPQNILLPSIAIYFDNSIFRGWVLPGMTESLPLDTRSLFLLLNFSWPVSGNAGKGGESKRALRKRSVTRTLSALRFAASQTFLSLLKLGGSQWQCKVASSTQVHRRTRLKFQDDQPPVN